MAKYSFLRHGEVHERRVQLNKVEKTIDTQGNKSYYSTRDIQQVLCDNEVSIGTATVRHWLRNNLMKGFKRKTRRRWYVSQKAFRTFLETMRAMNEQVLENEFDPVDMRYGVMPERRERRQIRQKRREPQERARDGTFRKKHQPEYRQMYPRLG